mgnify:CR=1 FL=1
MSRLVNAQRVLGVSDTATRNDIHKAFQNRVSELSRNQMSPHEFSDNLNYLLKARDYLLYMYDNNRIENIITPIENTNTNTNTNTHMHNFNSRSQYFEMRNGKVVHASDSTASSINGRLHKEEKYYDSKTNTVKIKRTTPDGQVYKNTQPIHEYLKQNKLSLK